MILPGFNDHGSSTITLRSNTGRCFIRSIVRKRIYSLPMRCLGNRISWSLWYSSYVVHVVLQLCRRSHVTLDQKKILYQQAVISSRTRSTVVVVVVVVSYHLCRTRQQTRRNSICRPRARPYRAGTAALPPSWKEHGENVYATNIAQSGDQIITKLKMYVKEE